MANYEPPPYQDPIGYTPKGALSYLGEVWQRWILGFSTRVNQTPAQFPISVDLSAQAASIGSTPIPLPALTTGLYRVNLYVRVTTAGTVSSSISTTIGFTDDGVACAQSTTAYTGNVTTAPQSAVFVVSLDQGTPLTYSTTYASVGATSMEYKLTLTVEALPN